jgi:hypothetical protein
VDKENHSTSTTGAGYVRVIEYAASSVGMAATSVVIQQITCDFAGRRIAPAAGSSSYRRQEIAERMCDRATPIDETLSGRRQFPRDPEQDPSQRPLLFGRPVPNR